MFVYIMKKEIKVIDMERILDAAKKNNDHGISTALEGKYGLSLSAYFFTFLPIIKWEVIFWDSHLFKTT